jgi:hypothetical protein
MALFAYIATKFRDIRTSKTLDAINSSSPYRQKDPPPSKRGDDFLSRDRVAEKKKKEELESNVTIYKERGQNLQEDKVEVVGIAQPLGFWTKFVTMQKVGFLKARMAMQSTDKSKDGFWVQLIKAQATSQSKEQGKGR